MYILYAKYPTIYYSYVQLGTVPVCTNVKRGIIMPRIVRKISEYNLYHIVLKGNNSQQIFYDDYDYKTFLNILKDACKKYKISIVAYCLMNNHVHLMLKADENNIAMMFKSFGASFVYRYNKRYDRTGGIFNGRYYSKAVNDNEYFVTVIKYIHYNPVKAGICEDINKYKWSSYNSYKNIIDGLVDNEDIYVDREYLFTILDKNEFVMLHLNSEEDLINFFILDSSISKPNNKDLESFTNSLLNNYSVDYAVSKLMLMGLSRTKISKLVNVDRRKIKPE